MIGFYSLFNIIIVPDNKVPKSNEEISVTKQVNASKLADEFVTSLKRQIVNAILTAKSKGNYCLNSAQIRIFGRYEIHLPPENSLNQCGKKKQDI